MRLPCPTAQLAALAQTQEQIHQRLQEITPTNEPDLQALWQAQAEQLSTRALGAPTALGAGLPTPSSPTNSWCW
jgi:predicted component of type VI protein secretion system